MIKSHPESRVACPLMATSGAMSKTFKDRHSDARAEIVISSSSVFARRVNLCRAIFLLCSFCLVADTT